MNMIKKSVKAKEADKPPLEITSEEALAFIRELQKKFRRAPRTKAEKARVQEYLAKFTDRELRAVGSRVQSDLMLRPPETIPPKTVRKPTRRKRRD
jgi:hypothetical protein